MDAGGEKCSDAAAAEGGEGGGDLYAVLGLKKECSDADLKVAYRKLAKVRGSSSSVPDFAPSLRSCFACCCVSLLIELSSIARAFLASL
jgi:hypothetical protein